MKTAVIFGTFNPVTNAHIAMGDFVRQKLQTENEVCIIYVPAKTNFLKSWKGFSDQEILSDELRLQLLTLAAEEHGFLVDDCELTGISDGKTFHTMEYLCKKYHLNPNETYLVFGADKLQELNTWFRAKKLLETYQFVILSRGSYDMNFSTDNCHMTFYQMDDKYADISATRIRNYMKEKNWSMVKQYVPDCCFGILRERK